MLETDTVDFVVDVETAFCQYQAFLREKGLLRTI